VVCVACDAANDQEQAAAVTRVREDRGRLDLLVNNAFQVRARVMVMMIMMTTMTMMNLPVIMTMMMTTMMMMMMMMVVVMVVMCVFACRWGAWWSCWGGPSGSRGHRWVEIDVRHTGIGEVL
jgi:NAD(P)-dependent dehydrogenase (short-subunit alcohol dehydrogenase family)